MNILIKSVEIIDPNSSFNKKRKNILIENGVIRKISETNHKADKIIAGNNLKISPGWFDLRTSINDPGYEFKDDINSIAKAAAAGGFTELASLPNTKPVAQSKDLIAYIKSKSEPTLINIHPIAALTLENKGEEMTEMMDLHHAGAVAFSDGNNPIWHSDVMLKSLQYVQSFNGLIIDRPVDKHLTIGGQMNEGKTSTLLGFKGISKLAEELVVARNLSILEYTGGRLHFSLISSPKSLELIREAKRKGLNVTCDIGFYLLVLDDSLLTSFDTNLKVNPPLRDKDDIPFFWKAIADDTIDAIVTDHRPQDEESKKLEFDLANFGMIGLETAFAALNTFNKKIKIEKIIAKLTEGPRNILHLESPRIEEGEDANLTLFDTETEWEFKDKDIQSKSDNTPFVGKKFKGKVLGVFNKKKHFLN